MMKGLLLFVPCVAFAVLPEPRQYLDYEGMAENFRAISQKQAEGVAINQSTFNIIKDFVDRIVNLTLDNIDQDRQHAQQVYNDSIADIEGCEDTRCTTFLDAFTVDVGVAWFTANAETARDAFRSCKVGEGSSYTNQTAHCDIADAYVHSWNDGHANSSDTTHCTSVSFANGDSDAVEEYMTCICAFVAAHKSTYYMYRKNCLDATAEHAADASQCDTDQANMDQKYCDEQLAIQQMCHDYVVCRNLEETEHVSRRADVEGWEAQMQAHRVALESLKCFGYHIIENDTDISNCDLNHYQNCTSAPEITDCPVVIYGDYSDRMPCNEPSVANFPCSTEYQDWTCLNSTLTPFDYSAANVGCQACTPCAAHALHFPGGAFNRSSSESGTNCV